jgi:hypothetical protein
MLFRGFGNPFGAEGSEKCQSSTSSSVARVEAKGEPVDIVILTNGPGEVATWVKPVVATLRQSSKEQGIDMRISVNTLQIFTPYNVKGYLGTVDFALR